MVSRLDWISNPTGGAERYLEVVTNELEERGHDVTICSSGEEIDRENIERLGDERLGIFNNVILGAYAQHVSSEYDLVVVNNSAEPIPFVSQNRLDIIHIYHGKETSWLRRIVERLNLNFITDTKICVNPNQKEDIGADYSILNGTYLPENSREKQDIPMILFLGEVSDRKGVHLIPQVAQTLSDYDFVVAGTGPLIEEMKKRGKEIPNLKVLGYVSESRKEKLFQDSWVYLLPSKEEGFPLTALEAASYDSVPIIHKKIGRGFFDEEILLENRSIKEISETVEKSINGDYTPRNFAERNTWDEKIDNLEDILRKEMEE